MRTGYAEYLGSWKMTTGDLVVELQYAEQSVELEEENYAKHLRCLLCVTSCYFVAFFFETVT